MGSLLILSWTMLRKKLEQQHGGGVGAREHFLVALNTMPLGAWFHRYRSDELPLRNGVKDCHRLYLIIKRDRETEFLLR